MEHAQGFAGALLFLASLIGATIFGLYAAAYAAHSLYCVVEQTAAGADEVEWPDEPYQDWLLKAVHLAWLVSFWLAPLYVASGWLLGETPVPMTTTLAWAGFLGWLLFPLTLLSALGGSSRLTLLSPTVLIELLNHLPTLFTFYFLSGPVAVGAAVALFGLVVSRDLWPIVVAAPAMTYLFLLYGRLLGRLAQLTSVRDFAPAAPASPPPPKKKSKRRRPQVAAHDPWADEPPTHTQPRDRPPVRTPEGDQVGYDVIFTDNAPVVPAASRTRPVFVEDGGYDLHDEPPQDAPRPLPRPVPVQPTPSDERLANEMALIGRRSIKRLRYPWSVGTFGFPLYGPSLVAGAWLTGLVFATALFIRGMRGG